MILNFANDWLDADITSEEQASEYWQHLQDTTVYVAHFIIDDRNHGRSCDETDEEQFEEFLHVSPMSAQECEKARRIRAYILVLANELVDQTGLALRDDPNGL